MIGIEATYKMRDVEAYIDKKSQEWYNRILESLRQKGRDFTSKARARTKVEGGFNNITWNLRESIGYLLIHDGKVIESFFPKIAEANGGAVTGDAFARQISTDNYFDKGIVLLMVAGMDYASFVQNRGIDVLDTSSLEFEKELQRLWN